MMTFVIILLILISIAALISAAYYETPYLKPLVDKWLNKGHGSKDEAPLCDFPTSDDANGQMMRAAQ